MIAVNSYKYRHRVAVQRPVDSQDDITGELTRSWRNVHTAVPAEVLTGPGRELHAANTKLAETSARIKMRWFPGLLESMRILWDSKVFDIISIETDATARREYRLRVRDGMSDGS